MRVIVVNPPVPVVTWEEADEQLKLSGDAGQKDEVEAMVAAATAHIDGPDGWLGRAIGVQTLEARFEIATFGSSVRLGYPPLVDLVSVEYLDAADAPQTANIADFEIIDRDLLPLTPNFPWVGGSRRREAVRVRYRAGYQEVPTPIRAAILLMTGDLYRFRETAVAGVSAMAIPMSATVEDLLSPFRVYS